MASDRCDPTWNHPARSVLIYVLPLALAAACLHLGWFGSTRDLWLPLLWGFAVPAWNTRRRAGRPWAFKDYMNRDCYPPTIALVHAAVWCVWVNAVDLPLAALGFATTMLVYDGLMIRFRVLCIYAVRMEIHHRGTVATLLRYGIVWWAYVATGFALGHAFGSDGAVSVLLAAAVMILPAQLVISGWQRRRARPERLTGVGRVAVIGAGWNGIYATKWLDECGLEVTCFEERDEVGGIWNHDPHGVGGVFDNTRATSSKHFLHASDFPFDPSVPEFPDHTHVLDHLRRYAARFDVGDRVRLGTRVLSARRRPDGWRLWVQSGDETPHATRFDAVVVCSGPQAAPRDAVADHPLYSRFAGPVGHAMAYKAASDVVAGERLLIVGAGESAADIVAECVAAGADVHWSAHRGQWFADRNIGPYPADHFTATGIRALLGRFGNVEYLIRRFVIATFINLAWGCGGHGIRQWAPTAPYLHQFLNKSREGILAVYRGDVTPHRGLARIDGSLVTFENEGEAVPFDRIILATGYRPCWPFLDEPPEQLYRMVFDPADPTLAFVGFARPVLGSIPSLGEMQARWVANVLAGRAALPCRARRDVAVFHDRADHEKRFTDSSRLGALVDQEVYATELAACVGAEVRWLRLAFRAPSAFWVTLRSPWTAFKYRLHDPDPATRAEAAEHIRRELPDRGHPIHLLTGLLAIAMTIGALGLTLVMWLWPLEVVAAVTAVVILMAQLIFRITEARPRGGWA